MFKNSSMSPVHPGEVLLESRRRYETRAQARLDVVGSTG